MTTRAARQVLPAIQRSAWTAVNVLRESTASVAATRGRTWMTMLGTIASTASLLGTLGIGYSASGQVSRTFNELQATQVIVREARGTPATPAGFPLGADSIVRGLNGVIDGGVFFAVDYGADDSVRTGRSTDPFGLSGSRSSGVPLYGSDPGVLTGAGGSVRVGRFISPADVDAGLPVAVLGPHLAAKLGLESPSPGSVLFVGDVQFVVVGVLDDCGTLAELGGALVVPSSVALSIYGSEALVAGSTMIIRTRLGAAPLVAEQAPYALRPDDPAALSSVSPADWSPVARRVDDSMSSLLLAIAVVGLVVGCVSIVNAGLVSVAERSAEIGLRRALGATRGGIGLQFLLEAAAVGCLGGTIGAAGGVLVVLGVALAQGWSALLEPWMIAAAPCAGTVVGVLAGLYPSWRAGLIDPAVVLQRSGG